MLFARVVNRDDVRMIQSTRSLSLAKKTLFHFFKFVGLKFLCQSHGLDRHDSTDFWIRAQVDHAHGAFSKLLFNLVAPQHRLLHSNAAQQQRTGIGASTPPAENYGL